MKSPSFLFVGNGGPNCTQKQKRKQKKEQKGSTSIGVIPPPNCT
jgi:hypothetical protein